MNDLLFSCSEALLQPVTPVCAVDYGERVTKVVLSKTPITATGNVPTPAEIAESFAIGNAVIIRRITNGHRVFLSETEITIIEKEWVDKLYRIEGRIKIVDENVARACERLNRDLYVYYITENFYCFGPYFASCDFSEILVNGKGQPVYIQFKLDYLGIGIDYNSYDTDYSEIEEIISVTMDRTDITMDSTVITMDQT